MATPSSTPPAHTNRLARETSPYLLQHQHNPVDWYAWGPEAFEAARALGKPIFLSVGYSTCYWCHVMERQSFEIDAIAREMNQRFINIKVDREERPDVDQLYMTAVQVLTHHGGWPMSVFLTPDLRPFYGGTYFPPVDAHGRPGFVTILRAVEDAWKNRPGDVEKTAAQLTDVLGQVGRPQSPRRPLTVDADLVRALVERSIDDYDPDLGGFGGAPKFPRQTLLELLLHYTAQPGDAADADLKARVLTMVRHTLVAMAAGGIRDHLGGGFHRYSTDAQWLVPHFEIMLYDNAMLGWLYAQAHRQTGEPQFARIARGIFDFTLREMTSPDGAFYTAFDAEVDAQEGLTYLWTEDEITELLGPDDARVFNRVYGVDRGPNFADPHHGAGQPDKSILYLPDPMSQAARDLGMTPEALDGRLAPMRDLLYAARRRRKQPLLDTKVITSWNALMIRAMAYAGRVLDEPRYVAAAGAAADFLLARHRTPDGGLYRTSREGVFKYDAFLDDYAFLAQALLELHAAAAGAGPDRRAQAAALAGTMRARFEDAAAGGFYFTAADAPDMIVRQKIGTDSPLPSGNAIAALALLGLGETDAARGTISAFAGALERMGEGMSATVQAILVYLESHPPFVVTPAPAGTSADDDNGNEDDDGPLTPEQLAGSVVALEAAWPNPAELRLRVRIAAGFHINAHAASEGLIPTRLTVADHPDASVEYPPAEERRFAFADRPLRVYEGEVVVTVRFPQPLSSPPPIRLALTYQACDETTCLVPVTKQLTIPPP